MSLDIHFPEDLDNRISALEAAAEMYTDDRFRSGVLFGLRLMRLSLGLESMLTIPHRLEVISIIPIGAEAEREGGEH